jgi:hypothetical protein
MKANVKWLYPGMPVNWKINQTFICLNSTHQLFLPQGGRMEREAVAAQEKYRGEFSPVKSLDSIRG